jgi:hypothetical protein
MSLSVCKHGTGTGSNPRLQINDITESELHLFCRMSHFEFSGMAMA